MCLNGWLAPALGREDAERFILWLFVCNILQAKVYQGLVADRRGHGGTKGTLTSNLFDRCVERKHHWRGTAHVAVSGFIY